MKPENIHPRNDELPEDYEWSKADRIVSYARENSLLLREHALVWHNQTASWMTEGSREETRQIMKDHIEKVVN